MSDNTKECPSCAMDIDETEDICPICQYEFAETHRSKRQGRLLSIILFVILLGFLLMRLLG